MIEYLPVALQLAGAALAVYAFLQAIDALDRHITKRERDLARRRWGA